MNPPNPLFVTRRQFFGKTSLGLGGAAMASLLPQPLGAATAPAVSGGLPGFPNFAPKAKRVIYLFMSGGPAQQDLFDYKPKLREMNGQPLPPEVRGTQRLTGMSSNQSILALAGSHFDFKQHGQSNPHFPALRSGPLALSGASRRKQTPSSESKLLAVSYPDNISPSYEALT